MKIGRQDAILPHRLSQNPRLQEVRDSSRRPLPKLAALAERASRLVSTRRAGARALLALVAHSLCAQNLLRPPTNPPSTIRPAALQGVGIEQKLSNRLPLDLHFRDETGRDARLAGFFTTRPVIITPVYYGCPMLCTQILNGLVSGLKPLSFNAGEQFDVLAVSFDPAETPELALKKKETDLKRYGRAGADKGFHFLTGDEASIKALTEALGFRYTYDPRTKQFAHASGLMIATADGRISRYLYGIDYAPRDLRLALVEAADRKIGSPVDELLLFCYHYDPATGKYGAIAMSFVRLAGAATVLGIVVFLTLLFRRDLRHRTT